MLSERLQARLAGLADRHVEIAGLLAEPDAAEDMDRFTRLSREYAELEAVVNAWNRYQAADQALAEARELQTDGDPEMRALAEEDASANSAELERLAAELQVLLIPRDPNDAANVFLEIRAGTGGDEAALFAGDLQRMYLRYAELRGWRAEVISASPGEVGGFREVVTQISGEDVYARLKFESGAHRVQRVPETESQGRIHTSACTVAVLPEVDAVEDIDIDRGDLRIDTYRASGAGGQHVNKTDSAVRLTHLPTGIVVECQDERSQHKNRDRAMKLLHARLMDRARDAQAAEEAATRRSLVGSGDRSERIRTYNFPQGRITDHRINLTLYKLDEIMAGQLDALIDPLITEHQADQLAALGEEAA